MPKQPPHKPPKDPDTRVAPQPPSAGSELPPRRQQNGSHRPSAKPQPHLDSRSTLEETKIESDTQRESIPPKDDDTKKSLKKPKRRPPPTRGAPKQSEADPSGKAGTPEKLSEKSGESSAVGKKRGPPSCSSEEENPLKAILIHNLNQSHNTQRKRDIKQNYKAKLPLEKLVQEHEKKQGQLLDLVQKREAILGSLNALWDRIGYRQGIHIDTDLHLAIKSELVKKQKTDEGSVVSLNVDRSHLFTDQVEAYEQYQQTKQGTKNYCHWDYLLKEMAWMAKDFDSETKKKVGDAKKMVRNAKKHIHEKHLAHEKSIREQKVELKRKSKFMSNMVQMYWKSCEKIVKHNYNVDYERKRQQIRTKKLENFVTKHLRLSVKVAETLNTKGFVEKSALTAKADASMDESKIEASKVEESRIEDSRVNDSKVNDSKVNDSRVNDSKAEVDSQALAEETVDMATTFLPTGHTLDQAKVSTKIPFLLKGSLREYQIIGLDWLVTLHNRKLNGILADEMGLGKTIQTISMLASLACDKGVWGPHLIVVPTTIIMNWEMEFKRWCPGLKILTYFGSQKERKIKRHGWSKENSFHVCITSYKLVIQDHFAFRRKKWYYMILDEAQNIKNFKSQRWQTLLRFNTKRRLLLTGTPLQNDVMELWSLMHFLMPHIFANMQDFKEWFSNPFTQSINQNKSLNLRVVQKLQSILRPFLLRRMKKDVEKQLPEKIEHIVQCNLSRRQRLLYDEYINHDKTRNILADSDFFSIMSVLMQLRKVCNHPDLFEARTIESPFILTNEDRVQYSFPTFMLKEVDLQNQERDADLSNFNFRLIDHESNYKSVNRRALQLLPEKPLTDLILSNKEMIGPNESIYLSNNRMNFSMMSQRTFAYEGLAVSQKHFTNGFSLRGSNCQSLQKTIPNIMPFDSNQNYRMQYHKVPDYLNAACLPFNQNFFSIPDYDQMRYSGFEDGLFNPVNQYASAIQEEEQKQMLVNLARRLALWHAKDRQNRLQILHSVPVFGADLRQAVAVPMVCSDIFESKPFKYLNWKSYKQLKEKDIHAYRQALYESKQEEVRPSKNKKNPKEEFVLNNFSNFQMFQIPSAVLNPFALNQMWRDPSFITPPEDQAEANDINEYFGFELMKPKRMEKRVHISEWPQQDEAEVEKLNKANMLIKEITTKTREALEAQKEAQRLLEEHKEREVRMKQPKKVVRRKVIETETWDDEFTIVIDMGLVNKEIIEEAALDMDWDREELDQIKIADEKASQKSKGSQEKPDQAEAEENQGSPKKEEAQDDQGIEAKGDQVIEAQAEKPEAEQLKEEDKPEEDTEMEGGSAEGDKPEEAKEEPEKNGELPPPAMSEEREVNGADGEMKDETEAPPAAAPEDPNPASPTEADPLAVVIPLEDDELHRRGKVYVVEDKRVRIKKETKVFEEVITYEEYLLEQVAKEHDSRKKTAIQIELDAYNNYKQGNIVPSDPKSQLQKAKAKEEKPVELPQGLLSMSYKNTDILRNLVVSPTQRAAQVEEMVKNFKVIVPKVVAKPIEFIPSRIYTRYQKERAYERFLHQKLMQHKNVSQSLKYSNILFFPHRNLIQYDCGKLQKMAQLLKQLYNKGSKVIIFTQMTKMLDIFEQFLNLHGYIYVRLDGSVKTENRQKLVDRFNFNKRIFCFISSTRCGGVGINLTGADCVIFYDTDWNPAMDKQAQDRCHRIGQTKTVHIYRLISQNTIEENIFKKSLQKRELGGLIIEGNFNQEFFQKVSVKDMLTEDKTKSTAEILTEQAKQAIIPKRIDIFKDENIVFDDGVIEGDIILKPQTQEQVEEVIEDNNEPVDFEANSQDMELQAQEHERQRQIEQYRRRFEEALIRIEDQEDVQAMQFANQEIRANDDQDLHEFVETNILDENEDQEGVDDAEDVLIRKQKEKQAQLELQRQREELQAKQRINDGISLTQGEMKKHEEIDWNLNPKLNQLTKTCLNYISGNFSFEDYLDDRARKDPKFVNLHDELNTSLMEEKEKKSEQSDDFSMSSESSVDQDWDHAAAGNSYQEALLGIWEKLFKEEEENKVEQQ